MRCVPDPVSLGKLQEHSEPWFPYLRSGETSADAVGCGEDGRDGSEGLAPGLWHRKRSLCLGGQSWWPWAPLTDSFPEELCGGCIPS